MQCLCSFFMFLGRLFLSANFLVSGFFKIFYSEAPEGVKMIPILLVVAGIVELVGALSLILGFKTRAGAILLILYLIPIMVVLHHWDTSLIADMAARKLFLNHLAIIGGLLYVACCGAGGCSCDRWCKSCTACEIKKPE